MIYLIDGHNLIGKMPTIDLADPDDEEKLVVRLQNWALADRKRRIEVIFDSGPFGGIAPHLSGLGVEARFTKLRQTADEVLIDRLRRVKNPQEVTLVTSDREIIAVARQRRVGHILAEEFVELLAAERAASLATLEKPAAGEDIATDEKPDISEAEVAEWLEVFSKVPRYRPEPRPRAPLKRPAQVEKEPEPEKPPPTTEELKAGASMTAEDVAAWLAVFGDKPADGKADIPISPKMPTRSGASSAPKSRKPNKNTGTVIKNGERKLSPEEIAEWLDIFKNPDNK